MSAHEHSEKKPHASHGHHGGGGGHGDGEHEGAPEWLISFADNVMLQMGFFVILLALNLKEPTTGGIGGKEQQGDPPTHLLDAAIAIREAFNNPVDLNSTNPSDIALIQRIMERRTSGQNPQPGPIGNRQDMQSIRPSDYIAPNGLIPFDDGVADLSPAARQTLAEVARAIAGQRFIIEVRGNASSAEAARSEDRGMRLSYERALVVARALEEHGVRWRQIRVVALGDTNRLTPRAADSAGHRSNQRTEVFQTQEIMPEDPYSRDWSNPAPKARPQ